MRQAKRLLFGLRAFLRRLDVGNCRCGRGDCSHVQRRINRARDSAPKIFLSVNDDASRWALLLLNAHPVTYRDPRREPEPVTDPKRGLEREDRVAIMQERVRRREQIFHPEDSWQDRQMMESRFGLLIGRRQNGTTEELELVEEGAA